MKETADLPTSDCLENISSSDLPIEELINVCISEDNLSISEAIEKNNSFYHKSIDISPSLVPDIQVVTDPNPEHGLKSSDSTANKSTLSLVSIKSIALSSTSEQLKNKGFKKYLGFTLTLLSGLLYSLTALIFKLLKDKYHTFTISLWRYQGVLIPSIILVLFRACIMKQNDFKSIWPLNDKEKAKTFIFLMLRGILGCWGLILQFYSLLYLQVADCIVITSSTSVFVTLLAHCFIGEKCALVPIFTAFLAVGGVFVISRPPMLTGEEAFDTNILIGIGLAFGCMFVSAVILVIQRYLRTVHFSLTSLSSGIWGTIQCLVLALTLEKFTLPETEKDIFLASSLAIVTFFAQNSIILALKFEQAGPVSVVQSCDVIFAFMWQFAFLGVIPDYFSLVGALIIIFGVLLTAFRKYLSIQPEDSKLRKNFKLLLL